ncbi:foldase protein PrsA 1 precursor [bacterium BMS3Bbin09]|nr:foldase protein PrsA 1 precursor [bacterium BMS3Bbin09]
MKKLFYSVILLSFTAALLTGCLGGKDSDSPVIAKVNNDVVTQEDFLKEISRVPEWARGQFEGQEGKDKFLDEIIKRELIYQNALDMKLDNDEEYIAKVEEFKKMTLISLLLQKEVEEKATVSEAEIKDFFDKNEEKFRIGTEIKASHILVETEKKAKDIINKINNGEKFAKLAKKYSKDKGSAEKGGDLGYFGRGKMVPEFERAALSLKKGELSAPVKTRFGFHIIKLIDIKEGEPANFEQSKGSIQKQLISLKRKQLFDTYIESLKSTGKIEKNEELLKSIVLPWEKAVAPAPEPAPAK